MRYASIDLLRVVAIALMVLVHFLENLAGVLWSAAGFGAPLFAFLAGVSLRLWVRSQEGKGTPAADITRVAVRRGLFLFALGLAFNFFVWLPDDVYNWDVLTMIGTGLILLAFARDMPAGFLVFVSALIFTLAPFLRVVADYDAHWLEFYFQHDRSLPEIAIGYFATGYFPLFPWVLFPLCGYAAGKVVFPDPGEPGTPSVRPLLTWGGVLVAASVSLRVARPFLPDPLPTTLVKGWTMFPASPEYVTGVLGLALVLFGGLHVWVDRRRNLDGAPRLLTAARTMSQHSLSIYLLHHVLHLWPLWVYGYIVNEDATDLWRKAMPVEAALALVPVCLGVCYLVAWLMARRGWPSAEGVARWVCD